MTLTADKIKACILGHAIGDALGVPVEFETREEIDKNPVTDMRGYGRYPYPAGSWSDDTSMTLCTLESLAKGKLDYDDIMLNFGKWLDNNEFTPTGKTFGVGRTCLHAIVNYFQNHTEATKSGGEDEYSNGNGSLMRILPFSLLTWFNLDLRENYEAIIGTASAMTHAHERSKMACQIYTLILFHLLDLPRKDSIVLALDTAMCRYFKHPEYSHFERLFCDDFQNLSADDIRSSGYVVDSLEAALWCVLTTDSYQECVLKAVNLGDDTDTVAAIAGGLAGALYGLEGIPTEWLEKLQKREYLESLCDMAAKAWTSRNQQNEYK